MGIKTIRRVFRYLFRGVPVEHITVDVKVHNTGDRLEGKVVLVTGGAKGIGLAIARKCIAEGAAVLICGRNEADLIEAQKDLGERCSYLPLDVARVERLPEFFDKAFDLMGGRIDCLVNNAGVSFHETDFRNVTVEGFEQQFDVNFKGAYFAAKYFIQKLERTDSRQSANILFISSERGSFCTDIPYGLSKAAIDSLVGALAVKLYKSHSIRVNGLAPGVTVSGMTGRRADSDMSYSGSPAGRVFMPEEVAEVACFLLSDYSSCISGEIIHCNAGAHLKCI